MKQSRTALVAMAFMLAALILTASGCSMDAVKEYSDPSVTIEVEKGEEFAIVLGSNPTTGYSWRIAGELDAAVVTLESSEYIEPKDKALGAQGEEKWTFKAAGIGRTTIGMIYVRPWEVDEGTAAESRTPEAEAGEGTEGTGTGETAVPGLEEPTEITFTVVVGKAGSAKAAPKKYADPDEAIEVDQGYQFAVVLESNPTTGYSWRLAEPLDEEVVELVSSEFKKTSGSEGEGENVGGGGEETWTFKAVGEGETAIKLEYVRPWEENARPEEEKTFSVTVKPVGEEAEK